MTTERRDLLDAAREVILETGLKRVTLAEVARRAGVSRTTVYRQHADLSSLVSALLTRELTQVLAEVEADVHLLPTARERLVESAVMVVRRMDDHPVYRRILDLDPELLLPLVVERLGSTQRAALTLCAAQIVAGQSDGSIRHVDPEIAATAVLLTCQSFVFSARLIDAEVVDELRHLLNGYLRV